jgi:amidase
LSNRFPEAESTVLPPISTLHAELCAGTLTSVALTQQCLDRIEQVDGELHAVLAVDDTALAQAEAADARYRAGQQRGRLDGIPLLVKDNIDTAGLATTCGSRLLAGSPPVADAAVVSRLREVGAVILGKTNLTEWANFRSTKSTEGWSAVGGQTRNPYLLAHSPGGSSSGSAVAVAAGMVPLALGTETDGSVIAPAGLCGVVGVKPEPGLLPLQGVAVVSPVQDAIGLLAGRLDDAVTALQELTGRPAQPVGLPDIDDLRLGSWQIPRTPEEVCRAMDTAVEQLTAAGVQVVPLELPLDEQLLVDGMLALTSGFRPALEAYLRTRPGVPASLDEIIACNAADPIELALFGQDLFEQATLIGADERAEAAHLHERARVAAAAAIEKAMLRYGVDAILAPSNEPAWMMDYELGDPYPLSSSTPSSLARFPNLSVPIGLSGHLPVGMSIFGPRTLRELVPLALCVEGICSTTRSPAS